MTHPKRYISRLRLTSFRNYASAALDLDHSHVVLTGPNGAGKTNLLEAVSLLSAGRGLRRARFDNLAQLGSEGRWAVAATIHTPAGVVDIGTGGAPQEAGRRVRINGANARAVDDMSEYVRMLWLTPAMDGLFSGPATDRRRFLDRLVTTLIPDHNASILGFDKAMRQRNRLLEESADPAWLGAIEVQMAAFAAAISFARIDCIAHLQQLAAGEQNGVFPAALLALDPVFPTNEYDFASSSMLEQALIDHWRQSRPHDQRARRTLVGPHRVDLKVTHAQKSMPARLCSTGEQKGLLIGLVLAHARLVATMTSITPLLLFDEIAAHLDPERREALFAAIDQLNTQCFMSGTDPMLFEALAGKGVYIGVKEGRLIMA
ncbi:DNA recombination and repair protein RecF [hydrothermal vent metagenome]|uniref:DNA replication and repair protein RecF n=1 Tax=hydrothermal vent metagenome TaxID=652676 RepID=A0A3B0UAP5_9ZZZZ